MIKAIAIGVSAGGAQALDKLLPQLPSDFGAPIIVVQHVLENSDVYLANHLNRESALSVKVAEERERMLPGHAYIAPAHYHLLVEDDSTFSLSADPPVRFSRPSIDVLFMSAADAFQNELVGIVLTGANSDGAAGLSTIKANGGIAIVQDPATADVSLMPQAAIEATDADAILNLQEIAQYLRELDRQQNESGPAIAPQP